ncbi:MAG: response regulator RpfG family c-di-GMP phosphodiesterase [Alteromonadaceae bacterium]|jgi:response regulator RpfG family c-di-GMP phosphodiesterase
MRAYLQQFTLNKEQLMPEILTILASNSREKQQIYLCGAQDYISYPFIEQEVNHRVRQAIRYRHCFCQKKKYSIKQQK